MRLLRPLLAGYLLLAALMRLLEAAGLRHCGCSPECWCQRAPMSAFRWVFPYAHRPVDPGTKADRAEA
jgi:hypothetical protein